jgi:hypothetical protein
VSRIYDLGNPFLTGPSKNPSAIVLGIDIDFQESTIDCPPNAFFEIDNWWDFLQDSDNKGKFDVVHLGSLAG